MQEGKTTSHTPVFIVCSRYPLAPLGQTIYAVVEPRNAPQEAAAIAKNNNQKKKKTQTAKAAYNTGPCCLYEHTKKKKQTNGISCYRSIQGNHEKNR